MQSGTWTEELLTSLVKGHRLMDPTAWAPPNPFLLDPLFEDLWLKKIQQLQERTQEKRISFNTLANTIMGPACIRKEFRWALWGMKLLGWPTEQRLDIIRFYRDILTARAQRDPFNLREALWHSEEEVISIVQDTPWIVADADTKKLVGKLSANCPPLAWALHTDFFYHRAYEVYGLYKDLDRHNPKFSKSDMLMIRQYGPFQVPELWPHTTSFPVDRITIKGIYDNLHCDFDYINHFTTADNIPEKLKYWSVEVDGRAIHESTELKRINEQIVQMVLTQATEYKKLDAEGLKRLTVLSKYYALKELFDFASMPWYPEPEVFDRFVNKELLSIRFTEFKDETDKDAFWRELFDPFAPFKRPELLAVQLQLQDKLK